MENILISVILPTYNGLEYIKNAIDSVLSQSYNNFELIIINDASIDNVEDIILKYKEIDNRIIYIKNNNNLERSASKNLWVNKSRWKYIAFIDDDDIWVDKDKLNKQLNIIQNNNNIWIVWTNAICINEKWKEIWKFIMNSTNQKIRNKILLTNQFIQSSILLKKDTFLKAWWFNEKMNLCEDYDLWLRIWNYADFHNINESCIHYTIRNSNTTLLNQNIMKNISIKLAWENRKFYPNISKALIIKLITYFLWIKTISKINKLLNKN